MNEQKVESINAGEFNRYVVVVFGDEEKCGCGILDSAHEVTIFGMDWRERELEDKETIKATMHYWAAQMNMAFANGFALFLDF